MDFLFHIGRYFNLLRDVFSTPERWKLFWKRFFEEVDSLGVLSLGIVGILSVFMGAVITLQTSTNIDSAFIPAYVVGFASRQSVILEFSPTIISLILAGKVGSNIASEIGTMRVTQQIDALDIMGVNSSAYLILPKVTAAIFIFPFLIMVSMFLGIAGGWLISIGTDVISEENFTFGVQYGFQQFHIWYALVKTAVFAFIITSIAGYYGYYTSGGALEVGRSSTQAVVYSSVAILIANYVLTQLLLI